MEGERLAKLKSLLCCALALNPTFLIAASFMENKARTANRVSDVAFCLQFFTGMTFVGLASTKLTKQCPQKDH